MLYKLASKKGHSSPQFSACLLWPNSWMDQDATWYGGRPRPPPHCVRWGPSSRGLGGKGHSSPTPFSGPLCSDTVAHLSNG